MKAKRKQRGGRQPDPTKADMQADFSALRADHVELCRRYDALSALVDGAIKGGAERDAKMQRLREQLLQHFEYDTKCVTALDKRIDGMEKPFLLSVEYDKATGERVTALENLARSNAARIADLELLPPTKGLEQVEAIARSAAKMGDELNGALGRVEKAIADSFIGLALLAEKISKRKAAR